MKNSRKTDTSWEKVSSWYDGAVGESGHYYHKHVILPNLSRILCAQESSSFSLLDLACGQGILSRFLPKSVHYVGVDLSSSLLFAAKEKNKNKTHSFCHADAMKPLPIQKQDFDFCTIILALQNMQDPLLALKNAFTHLKSEGSLVLVLNHPCFRIPRQSSWGIDEEKQIQYRRIDRYQTPMTIPIQAHPSRGKDSEATPSFHFSLTDLTLWLYKAGFVIEWMEEWCSDKKSTGRCAKREDRSRKEIPLFLSIKAKKYLHK